MKDVWLAAMGVSVLTMAANVATAQVGVTFGATGYRELGELPKHVLPIPPQCLDGAGENHCEQSYSQRGRKWFAGPWMRTTCHQTRGGYKVCNLVWPDASAPPRLGSESYPTVAQAQRNGPPAPPACLDAAGKALCTAMVVGQQTRQGKRWTPIGWIETWEAFCVDDRDWNRIVACNAAHAAPTLPDSAIARPQPPE